MSSERITLNLLLVALSFSMVGCFSSRPEDISFFDPPAKIDVTADNYILEPPDEVEIHCTSVPEVHLQRQQIRPDGRVSFESLGEIYAAGRTPKELADIIREKILLLYSLPGDNPVDVRIAAFRSKFYYVIGQVYFEGPKMYTGRDTVFTAISKARPNVMAWLGRIQVIRPAANANDRAKIFEINFDRMSAHGELGKNVLLKEGDIIYVPPTILAAIALKVEEFVRPIGRAFSTVNIVEGTPGNSY